MAGIRLTNRKLLKDTEPLFSHIAKEYPHGSYTSFCEQFGIRFDRSQSILARNQSNHGKAVKEVLNIWLNKGQDVTQVKLESAFTETDFGGHIKNLKKFWKKAEEDEFSEDEEPSSDAEWQPKKRKVKECPDPKKRVKREDSASGSGTNSATTKKKIERPFSKQCIVVEKMEERQKKDGDPFYRLAILVRGKQEVEDLFMFKPSQQLLERTEKLKPYDKAVFTDVNRFEPLKIKAMEQTNVITNEDVEDFKYNRKVVQAYITPKVITVKEAIESSDGSRISVKGLINSFEEREKNKVRKHVSLSDELGNTIRVTLWSEMTIDTDIAINDALIVTAVIKKDNNDPKYKADFNSTGSTVLKPWHKNIQKGKVIAVTSDPSKRQGTSSTSGRYPLSVVLSSGKKYKLNKEEDKIKIQKRGFPYISFVPTLDGLMTNLELCESDDAPAESTPPQSSSDVNVSDV